MSEETDEDAINRILSKKSLKTAFSIHVDSHLESECFDSHFISVEDRDEAHSTLLLERKATICD